ncbi:MAG: hypothetical protein ACM3NW_07365 [Syntrophomonadaceae bacterium]
MRSPVPALFGAVAFASAALSSAQTPTKPPAPATPPPSHHHAEVAERGDHVMGFDHTKTTHHFTLTETGGVIAVSANDASDTESRDAIRRHLRHEAEMLGEGNFHDPMTIHDRVPPGVPVLKRDHAKIRWTYADTERGGEIVITAPNAEDRKAVHEFLRFQIEDHGTGDPLEVSKKP